MSNFMYSIIDAVELMQNAVAKSQIVNADTTTKASEMLTIALNNANTDLDEKITEMNELNPEDEDYSDQLAIKNSEYQNLSQQWGSVETMLNTNVQVANDMTTRDSQHQQSLVQFASIVSGVNTYLGNLLQSGY